MHTYIHTYIHTCIIIPTYLPTYLPTSLPTYARTHANLGTLRLRPRQLGVTLAEAAEGEEPRNGDAASFGG